MTRGLGTVARDRSMIVIGYVVALLAAGICVSVMDRHPLLEILAADVVATVVLLRPVLERGPGSDRGVVHCCQ